MIKKKKPKNGRLIKINYKIPRGQDIQDGAGTMLEIMPIIEELVGKQVAKMMKRGESTR